MTIEWRVWHIPQIGGPTFHVTVPGLDTGILICDTLAHYDLFQFEHRIKPDYANASGIEYRGDATGGEWWGVDPDSEDDVADAREITDQGVSR